MDDKVRSASIIIALEELRRSIQQPEMSIRQHKREGGESGAVYIYRLLNESPTSWKVQLRIDRTIFVQLVNLMVERNLLMDSKYVKVSEQVGICLFSLAKGASYRDASDRFKHYVSTISMYHRKVLDALVLLSHDIIRPHRDLLEVPPEVANNSRYWPYFKDAIGAIDGTHIQAVINDENGVPFRNCRGAKSRNVLACCSFDRIFIFINVGWQGSAHDITIWRDCLTYSKYIFPHPPQGKYYLVDSGYSNTLGYMSLISDVGVRCHLPEYKHAPPVGISECFNHRHSSLRMKVEMTFGQLKKRWKVLKCMPQISEKYQMSVIVSCFTIHNIIQMYELVIPIIQHEANVRGTIDSQMFDAYRKSAMFVVRQSIALQIWGSNSVNDEMQEK